MEQPLNIKMKYIPSDESENINSSPEKNFSLNLLILVVSAFFGFFILLVTLGFLGEFVGQRISPSFEKKLFSFLDSHQKPWNLGNQILDNIFLLNELSPDLKPKIFLTCDSVINAYALPGRQIIFHNGLFKSITTYNSLYFIIGHELAHILNRDHLKSIGRSLAISFGFFLVTFSTNGNSLFKLENFILERKFNQHQESDADNLAMQFVFKRFNGLNASYELFDYLMKTNEQYLIDSFVSTHPLNKDRFNAILQSSNFNEAGTKIEKLDKSLVACE